MMSKATTIREILEELAYTEYHNGRNFKRGQDMGTAETAINKATEELLDLLESKAETLSTVEEKEPLLYGFVPVRAIPLTALRELEGSNE
jgi:hypothetical protein